MSQVFFIEGKAAIVLRKRTYCESETPEMSLHEPHGLCDVSAPVSLGEEMLRYHALAEIGNTACTAEPLFIVPKNPFHLDDCAIEHEEMSAGRFE